MKQLKTINMSVHHEMIGPLKANVNLSKRLMKNIEDPEMKKMLSAIFVSCQLLLLHSSDLLDRRIIKYGGFVPANEMGNVKEAITEMIDLVRMTLEDKNVEIQFQFKANLPSTYQLSFDRRRLQQVVLNLLTNAVKFTNQGVIIVLLTLNRSRRSNQVKLTL